MPGLYDNPLILRTAARYRQGQGGRWAAGMARGKLAGDPVFFTLLRRGLIADGARLLDLGCGKALFEALLHTAQTDPTGLPADIARVPQHTALYAIERDAGDVAHARQALGAAARIEQGDICQAALPPCDVVLILDVLHYLPHAAQTALLQRVWAALSPGGHVLLRVGDARQRGRFGWSCLVDRLVVLLRSGQWRPLWGRDLDAWLHELAQTGFVIEHPPTRNGTGFANVLLVARKR